MLACTRIGAPHTVVFAGFSADSLSGRINDAGAKVLVCADGGWRRGQIVPLKENSDEALKDTPTIEKVLVLRRTEQDVAMTGRPRRLVPRHRPESVDGVRTSRARRRAPAVPALHVRDDREAEGHPAHDRRLPRRRRDDAPSRSSISSATRTCTGAPPTSAGSPATATSSTGRCATARRRSCTKARPTGRTRTACGRSPTSTRRRSSTRPRPRSARS